MVKNKLNSIEGLVSQKLIDMEVSHKEFNTIMKEKKEDERKCEECMWKKKKMLY